MPDLLAIQTDSYHALGPVLVPALWELAARPVDMTPESHLLQLGKSAARQLQRAATTLRDVLALAGASGVLQGHDRVDRRLQRGHVVPSRSLLRKPARLAIEEGPAPVLPSWNVTRPNSCTSSRYPAVAAGLPSEAPSGHYPHSPPSHVG